MPETRLNVFISSTSIDLPAYRTAVRDAILTLGFHPDGMEHWPVGGDNPVTLCHQKVAHADVYLGIYAHRYGWRPDGYDGKSITELEYDWAADVTRDGKPIPRLCFIMRDNHPWPKDQIELDAQADLDRFKKRVKAGQVGFFTTPEDLKAQVTAALAQLKTTTPPRLEPIVWEPGAIFDEYTLRSVLGTGGNGQVWLADEHLPDGSSRPVAIKVLHDHIAHNPTRAERFRREIGSMARINYRHIVPVYTYGLRHQQLYVIMPYLQGGTLRARLTGQALPEAQTLHWLEQIGQALDHVHDKHSGLIHRDVKPENILLDADGETLYLSDFGLVFSATSDLLTDDGKPAGTGRYMAPEQWRGETLSRQTDLYALGILAYELLTGHLPFAPTSDFALGKAHCEDDLPTDPHLPHEVWEILQKATAKNPAERYLTARAFLTDLRNWQVDPANIEPRIRDYLKWVTDELYENVRAQFVELMGDETTQQARAVLPQLPRWDDDPDDLFTRASATIHADHVRADGLEQKVLVENVRERLFTLDRAVLVGEPGSGKSWMLRRLQADYARGVLHYTGVGRGLIPVLIRLNEYMGGSFEDFIKTALDTLAPYHDRLLREKRLVLLCDALNEMPRGQGQMNELIAYLQHAPYFIVSCRVRDYRDDLGDLKPLEQVLLRDLELPAVQELIHKRLPDGMGHTLWTHIGGTPALMEFWQQVQKANEGPKFWESQTEWWRLRDFSSSPRDWRAMFTGARLIPLARNPYMGDLLCRTYQQTDGHLPDSRAALFGQFVGQMLAREAKAAERRGEAFPDTATIENALVALARALQDAQTTVIAPTDAHSAIHAGLTGDDSHDQTTALLRAATDANILATDGDNLKFAHQLLQEYFAARILLEAMNNNESPARFFGATWWDAGAWRETTVILGEFLGEGARGANTVAQWLAPVSPEVALQVITRNGAGLTLADVAEDTKQVLIQGAWGRSTESNSLGRGAAYRVLGLFNADQRKGVSVIARNGITLPDLDWVEIPGGKFHYGHESEDDNPPQALKLPTFYITRYPITYTQFQCFVDAPDFNDDRWWKGMPEEQETYGTNYRTREIDEQWFKYANHPRDDVSWYQAIAFSRWLSDKLGMEFTLPTEQQWEKAARGTDGRVYPYGGDFDPNKGNTRETDIKQTSAVSIFPTGASPYGVLDMSGNAWQWCLNQYENSKTIIVDNTGNTRVLRGGSFVSNPDYARAVYRGNAHPDFRDGDIGFRVVCLVRPPS